MIIKEASDLLDAMANPQRLTILMIISRAEVSVGDLCEEVGLSQSAVSQHLAKLRARKVVKTRRDAQSVLYRCDNEAVRRILATLADAYDFDPSGALGK